MTNKVVWSGLSKAVQLNIQNGTYKEAITWLIQWQLTPLESVEIEAADKFPE